MTLTVRLGWKEEKKRKGRGKKEGKLNKMTETVTFDLEHAIGFNGGVCNCLFYSPESQEYISIAGCSASEKLN